jgi:hypothetical protein
VKDQYVADYNDYLKYALLRALSGEDLRLAIVWMLTAADGRADGQRLSYLTQPDRYRRLDPPLFDALGQLIDENRREVRAVEEAAVLTNADYISDEFEDTLTARCRYFKRVWEVAHGCDLIFFDPDNGLAIPSVLKGRRGSAKYLYWDELVEAYERKHSLVIYQHFPRRPRIAVLRSLGKRICEVTRCRRMLAISASHVGFLVIPQPPQEVKLEARLKEFLTHAGPYATTAFPLET